MQNASASDQSCILAQRLPELNPQANKNTKKLKSITLSHNWSLSSGSVLDSSDGQGHGVDLDAIKLMQYFSLWQHLPL
jgi:hypothetical protein